MNNQKNTKNQQQMNKSQSNATSATTATSAKQQEQALSSKQQASKSEYGTLTAKSDANNDYQ